MSHGHDHTNEPLNFTAQRRRRIRITLMAIVIPFAIATVVGMALLWPTQGNPVGSLTPLADGTTEGRAIVVSTDSSQCATMDEPRRTSSTTNYGSYPSAVCARVIEGIDEGSVIELHVPPEVYDSIREGTVVRALHTQPDPSTAGMWSYWDVERSFPMLALAVIYLVLVVIVARWRGAAAIAGLASSLAILLFFVMPALMSQRPALLVTLVGVSAMMFSSVYFAHGISIRTTTALIGTLAGVFLTVFLALTNVTWAHLAGTSSEDAQLIFGYIPGIHLQSLLICGIVIAGLGALNDVTITQASAVWELHAANPTMGKTALFTRAMRIGRDHIASTVYTLAFAYAGTALPALLLALIVDRPAWDIVTSSSIAEEIVRTLIASIGLIASIPLTTAIGTLLVTVTSEHHSQSAKGEIAPTHEK